MTGSDTGVLPTPTDGTTEPTDRDPTDTGDLDELDFDHDPRPEPDGPAPAIVAFDIGEVLIDETRVWATWAELLGVSGLTFASVMGAAIVQGEDHEAVFPHIAPNVRWEEFVEEHERRYGGFRAEDLYADVVPCLGELRDLGFRVAIAGNQPAHRAAQLVALGVPHDDIVMSAELGVEKPDAAFFATILDLVDATADPGSVLYVGDRVDNDIIPATSAGLGTCWLRRGPWGHLQDLPEDLEPDLVLEGLGELPLLLQHWREEEGA